MDMTRPIHPSQDELAAFLQGRLEGSFQTEVERHVAGCDSCCAKLHRVPDDTVLGHLREANQTAMPTANPSIHRTHASDTPTPLALIDHPRYRILKCLGAGGMGMVFKAEHRLMERPVALKVVRAELLSQAGAVDRFRQEMKAAGQLNHPNIVTAHDADQAGDIHFLVMEYVEGTSLDRLVRRKGPFPIGFACAYIRQAALGLQHAFERGMVHRDIKPQNLMLTRQGQVKVLDFGLARFATESNTVPDVNLEGPSGQALTEFGVIIGTPDYIAPEQARDSRQADIRADIYSLGCTLYYLLTGRPPFPKGSALEKLVKHFGSNPEPLKDLRPEVPKDLDRVVSRMMAKDPSDRFQTPAEVAQALNPFAKAGPLPHTPPPIPAKEPRPIADTPTMHADTISHRPKRSPATVEALAVKEETIDFRPKRARRQRPSSRWLLPLGIGIPVFLVALTLTLMIVGRSRKASENPAANKTDQSGLPVIPPGTFKPEIAKEGRVLMVLPKENFWYADYEPVRRILEKEGFRVKVASTAWGQARSENPPRDEKVDVDVLIKDAEPNDYDAVVFVGGKGVAMFKDASGKGIGKFKGVQGNPAAKDVRYLIAGMKAKGKVIAAVCGGQIPLADAGVLKDKRIAASSYLQKYSSSHGGQMCDKAVMVDGRLVTGRDASDAEAFAKTLARVLKTGQ